MTRLAVCAVCLLLALMSDGNSAVAQTGNANATSMEKNDNGTVSGVCPVPETGGCTKLPLSSDGIVRLSVVEVYPEYVGEYVRYAVEVGEISLRTEPGVLTMYAVAEKENPCRITILETYNRPDTAQPCQPNQQLYKIIYSTHEKDTVFIIRSNND